MTSFQTLSSVFSLRHGRYYVSFASMLQHRLTMESRDRWQVCERYLKEASVYPSHFHVKVSLSTIDPVKTPVSKDETFTGATWTFPLKIYSRPLHRTEPSLAERAGKQKAGLVTKDMGCFAPNSCTDVLSLPQNRGLQHHWIATR